VRIQRRLFLRQAARAVGFALIAPSVAWALDYPTKPARIIAPAPAGGFADLYARLIAQWLSERFARQVVVENRTGAGTNIGTEAAVRAIPDGHTLLLISSVNAWNVALYEKPELQFPPRHCPGRKHCDRTRRFGCSSLGTGELRPGTDRLCQSQSGPAHDVIIRRRGHESSVRRVVQIVGGSRHAARAVPWRRAGYG
jgi:hypothetical protein